VPVESGERAVTKSSVDFSFQKNVCAMEFKKFSLRFSKVADVDDAIRDDAHFV